MNFQSPKKVVFGHFCKCSLCFYGGAEFWRFLLHHSENASLQILKISISVKVKRDELSCDICVPLGGFCSYSFLSLRLYGDHGFTQKSQSKHFPLWCLQASSPVLGAHFKPLIKTSIWEPAPRQPQCQLTSITILGHGNFHYSSASSDLLLKDVYHICLAFLSQFLFRSVLR